MYHHLRSRLGHHFWPVSHLCCVWLSGGEGGGGEGGRGRRRDQQSVSAYVSNSPLADRRSPPLASSCPPISPLSSSTPCVSLSPCLPNCPLDFLFVYLLAWLSVVWQPAKNYPPLLPITPWETTSNIFYCMPARSLGHWRARTQTHTTTTLMHEQDIVAHTCMWQTETE